MYSLCKKDENLVFTPDGSQLSFIWLNYHGHLSIGINLWKCFFGRGFHWCYPPSSGKCFLLTRISFIYTLGTILRLKVLLTTRIRFVRQTISSSSSSTTGKRPQISTPHLPPARLASWSCVLALLWEKAEELSEILGSRSTSAWAGPYLRENSGFRGLVDFLKNLRLKLIK